MNNWQDEFMAEYHRQQIVEEIKQIRLEETALKSYGNRPRLFERTMFNFANWMISTGKHLRKRYTRSTPQSGSVDEIPAANSNQPPAGSFAHR
ncbi:MAG: hypothetical protein EHM40_15670 [Chloroflexi bacterium]|nr:MAG: hypothetical protein EHM40_15670 [Chloroflexota bacterium]